MNAYRPVDLAGWNRRATYEWFSRFSNPCYGVTATLDVTGMAAFAKRRGRSFFPCMTYAVASVMNGVEEMRLRMVDGAPVLFERTTPSYTVMTDAGMFVNVRQSMAESMTEFCREARRLIDGARTGAAAAAEESYNPDGGWDEIYLTSVPWLSLDGLTHPIPDDRSSQSVPRVCFDKYREENGRLTCRLNITVSHALVDGYPLCRTFQGIQEALDRCEELYAD